MMKDIDATRARIDSAFHFRNENRTETSTTRKEIPAIPIIGYKDESEKV